MSFFDKLEQKAKEFGKKSKQVVEEQTSNISQKSKEMIELTKLKLKRDKLEATIKEKHAELGEEVYRSYQGDKFNSPIVEKMCEEITKLNLEVGDLNKKMFEIKPTYVCPVCNTENDEDAKFCANCGNDLSSLKEVIDLEKDEESESEVLEDIAEEDLEEKED